MSYRRFVALGDSTTEGLMDPLPDGSGFRGWADRLAETLAVLEPGLRYANLAVRGKLARQVRETQLEPALALQPDLVSLLVGLNDMLRRTADVAGVVAEIDGMVARLLGAGGGGLVFTLPPPRPVNPPAQSPTPRAGGRNEGPPAIARPGGAVPLEAARHTGSPD